MRKLIVSMNVTLDGFMARPDGALDWHLEHWSDEMAETTAKELSHADTIILGRNTYEAMAMYWPWQARCMNFPRKDIAYAEMMNHHQKIVFSKTLRATMWNNSLLLRGNIKKEIIQLKQRPGKNIMVYGSGSIVKALVNLGLIDEYQLWVHPVTLGSGEPIFNGSAHTACLRLSSKRAFPLGVVLLVYETCP